MAATQKKLFILGIGYIGGSLLTLLLREYKDKYTISALVRKDEQAKELEKLGITPILGSLDEKDVITKATEESDVVVHVATADHLPSAEAILAGIRSRPDKTKPIVYLHTSGTGVLCDDSKGRFGATTIYSDTDVAHIDTLSPFQPHREIDLAIVKLVRDESKQLNARIGIIMPPLIYGVGSGPFNRLSIQVPALIRGAIKHKKAGTVREGLNVWSNVHVEDLVEGYVMILDALSEGRIDTSHNPYFFSESGQPHIWRALSHEIGRVLYSKGIISSLTVSPFTVDELSNLWPGAPIEVAYGGLGGNSVSSADRLRELGWVPRSAVRGGRETVYEAIEAETELVLKGQN